MTINYKKLIPTNVPDDVVNHIVNFFCNYACALVDGLNLVRGMHYEKTTIDSKGKPNPIKSKSGA